MTETTTDGYTVTMKDPSTGTVLAGSSNYTFTMKDDTAVDIYNTSTVALPETGGIGRGIFLYAGIALMLTAVITGCLLRRKYGRRVINAFVSSPAHAKYTSTRAAGTVRFH